MGMGRIFGAAVAGAAAGEETVGRMAFGAPAFAGTLLAGVAARPPLAGAVALVDAAPLEGAADAFTGAAFAEGVFGLAGLLAAAGFTLSVSRGRQALQDARQSIECTTDAGNLPSSGEALL